MSGEAALLEPFRRDPAGTAIVTDFDGTLAPIVGDPEGARAAPEVVPLLHRLAARYRLVAVLSGRPASFLAERLDLAAHPPGLLAVGLYGFEEAGAGGGSVRVLAAAERWRSPVEAAARRAEAELPDVYVERKGLSTTLHWRRAPLRAGAARALAGRLASELGLEVREGRMAAELVPPLPVDKGATVERLAAGAAAVLYLGDDLGDVPALLALRRMRQEAGVTALAVAVGSGEAPAELLAASDLVVGGVAGAVALLRELDAGGR